MNENSIVARAQHLGVAFVDIVSYSRRTTRRQIGVIGQFQQDINECLTSLYYERYPFFAARKLKFLEEVVKIPTGDGVALVLILKNPDIGDVLLEFAVRLLRRIHDRHMAERCDQFETNYWCDCHDHYTVRIGIASGEGFIYSDLNGNRNVAGRAINNASRIMDLGGPRQLLLSRDIRDAIVELAHDGSIRSAFRDIGWREVKHGNTLHVVQYIGLPGEEFVDNRNVS